MIARTLLLVSLLTGWTATAYAELITYEATLSGAAESIPNASPGTGFATVEYDALAHTLLVEVTFADLLGTVTAAHIHCCNLDPVTMTAGVATPTPSFPGFPAGVTSGSYTHLFYLTDPSSFNAAFVTASGGTAAAAEAALASGLDDGIAYFNIHTAVFPGGEIRGFLTVPEPASLSLAGIGLLALFAIGWRRPVASGSPDNLVAD